MLNVFARDSERCDIIMTSHVTAVRKWQTLDKRLNERHMTETHQSIELEEVEGQSPGVSEWLENNQGHTAHI